MSAFKLRLIVLFIASGLLSCTGRGADDPEDFKPFVVKSIGKPHNFGKEKGAHYFLWYDEGVWHLRTQGADKARSFRNERRITSAFRFNPRRVQCN